MKKAVIAGLFAGITMLVLMVVFAGWTGTTESTAPSSSDMVKRGAYLVHASGCNDCHSPKVFVPMGPMMIPVPDTTKLLSGYPASTKLPHVPEGVIAPDKWGGLFTNDLTAWAGPWGVTFTRNLTPDSATGLGSWTKEMFIKTIRTGKQMGEGRDILPPMPWTEYAHMTDEDLGAIFAYLRTLRPIQNAVPDPLPPPMPKKGKGK